MTTVVVDLPKLIFWLREHGSATRTLSFVQEMRVRKWFLFCASAQQHVRYGAPHDLNNDSER